MADEWEEDATRSKSMGFGGGGVVPKGFGRGVLRPVESGDGNSGIGKMNGFGGGRGFGGESKVNGFGGSIPAQTGESGGGGFGRGGFTKNEGSRNGFGGERTSNTGFGGGFGSKNEKSEGSSSGFGGGFGGGGTGGGSFGDRPPRGGGFGGTSTSGGGGGDRNCYKCGESGHMSRECPQGGGGGGDRNCYKCGESGHMSRECPQGGGGGGDRNCYKCGESGHMSRECPQNTGGGMALDKDRPAPYVPPPPTDDEEAIFKSITKGINFDNFDKIPVEVTGDNVPKAINNFEDAELYEAFYNNVKKAKYEKPTPVQKYAIPIISSGRDLMACAQTGSGKTAAFLLPTLTGMMRAGLTGGSLSAVQEPLALVVAPTRELATQIYMDARKFAHGTMLRPVVLYGGTSVGYQIRQVEQGTHILVGTPGRLLDILGKGKITLEKIKYLILDEADRMLDMGFGSDIKKIVEDFGMPGSGDRQTLMFSATFPNEIQRLAAVYLKNYLFLSVGVVGGANTDVNQHVFEVDRLQKREKLQEILTESGSDKTLVFVEQKRNADFLASLLSQTGFPTTSIHGDRLQREREEALADFKTGKAPILIATSVAARGLDIPAVKHVINYDLPQSIDEYVHRIGRTGRCGNLGKATSFFMADTDSGIAKGLVKILAEACQIVPEWLEEYAKGSIPTAGRFSGGSKFGGKDIRKGVPRTRDEGENPSFGGSFGGGFSSGMSSGPSQFDCGAEDEESWD